MLYLLNLLSGILHPFNKMINVQAGKSLGIGRGVSVNYFEATILSLLLLMLTNQLDSLHWQNLRQIPLIWFAGTITAFAALLMITACAAKTSVAVSSVLILAGQLCATVIMDFVLFERLSVIRVLGIILIIIGSGRLTSMGKEKVRKDEAI